MTKEHSNWMEKVMLKRNSNYSSVICILSSDIKRFNEFSLFLEEQYDCQLRGIDGEELVEVDTTGKRIRTLGRKLPVAGGDLRTTINISLQQKMAKEMKDIKGAAIITDPSGEVLAFYSSPSFDPSDISGSLDDESMPLFNRVIGGAFHPGCFYLLCNLCWFLIYPLG